MNLLRDLADLLAPRACCACGRRLSGERLSLCVGCLRGLPRVRHEGGSHGYIERLFWGQLPVERAAAMFYYHTAGTRRLVLSAKYAARPLHLAHLSEIFADELLPAGFFGGIDALVPVPLHWRRQLRRSYNQADYVARGIRRATGLPVWRDVVRRERCNPSQTRLDHARRSENVDGVFRLVRPGRVEGRHVLLVDDVLTTGATLLACGRELARARGARISVLTLAFASEAADYRDFRASEAPCGF